MNDGMTMIECSSFAVLSRETDVVTLNEEGGKGEGFSKGPIEAVSCLDHLELRLETILETRMKGHILGEGQKFLTEFLELFEIDSCACLLCLDVGWLETGPVAFEPVGGRLFVRMTLLEALVEVGVDLVVDLLDVCLGEDALFEELL